MLGQALGLWRGAPLSDLAYEPFAQGAIARLEGARLDALEDRLAADLALGRHRALIGELEGLASAHPERERLLGHLMLGLYRSGRQTEALAVYRRGRRALQDELGLAPGPELRALERQILDHDPQLKARETPASRTWRLGLIATGVAVVLAAALTAGLAARGHATAIRVQSDSLVAIDATTNRVVGDVLVGARPGAVAAAAGALWVGNLDEQTVSRVDRHRLRARAIPVGGSPTGIAAAGGRVWVVRSPAAGLSVSVMSIDPQFNHSGRPVRVPGAVPGAAGAIAAHGSTVYVAPGYGRLATLDASGRIVARPDPDADVTAIATGLDGAVWTTDDDANTVTRIDRTGSRVTIPVGNRPSGIAAGAGAMWVAYRGDGTLARIDLATHTPTRLITVGSAPAGVAFGAGSVWVANSGDGTVSRINPHTGDVTKTIAVGGSPQAIVVAYGRVWVTEDARTIPPAAGRGTLRVDSPGGVDSMDPAKADDVRSGQLLYETCAQLLNYPDRPGAAGAELVPEVAAALPTISPDGRIYDFTIRPGFRFSPPVRAPVTAQTFKATIERTLDPRMHSPVATELGNIAGARAYMAGRAAHVSGVRARGDRLAIRLVAPEGDLPTRLAQPAFCAVPPDTPHLSRGVRRIPMAGPYRIADDTPGQGVVLTRNPSYHGNRPRRFARIEYAVGMTSHRAVAEVERGTADYTASVPDSENARLRGRYGDDLYRVQAGSQLDYFAFNTQRPLFADVRTRQAVNFAIDRAALNRLGDEWIPLPQHETDHYIPPGLPGYRDTHVYPVVPDLPQARRLATPRAQNTLILDVCDVSPCPQQGEIVKTDLERIGLKVQVKRLPDQILFAREAHPDARWDMAWGGLLPDYRDPSAILNDLLSGGAVLPPLANSGFQARLEAADRLSGARRYLAYAQLDDDLARNAAPLVAFGNDQSRELLSARVGCAFDSVYGMDLGALCQRGTETS